MNEYRQALAQLDALISHFRNQQSQSCAIAEQEDSLLIKLADLKADLKPENQKEIADINRFYRKHIHE